MPKNLPEIYHQWLQVAQLTYWSYYVDSEQLREQNTLYQLSLSFSPLFSTYYLLFSVRKNGTNRIAICVECKTQITQLSTQQACVMTITCSELPTLKKVVNTSK